MIVRLMGEGQYRLDDALATQLNGLDDEALAALERGDEDELDRCLDAMWRMVRAQGAQLPTDEIVVSDVIIPPTDLTLEETRSLFSEHGLVPDLPV
jgi:PspA-Associated protein